jgi:hypothetical protein
MYAKNISCSTAIEGHHHPTQANPGQFDPAFSAMIRKGKSQCSVSLIFIKTKS